MTTDSSLAIPRFPALSADRIHRAILLIRDRRVIVDTDLAAFYGVATKAFNQAVKRNRDRFPSDFMFRLTPDEKTEVVTKCDHLRKLKYSPVLPVAFTEHGAIMAASVLNSPNAIAVSVYVVRAFVRFREAIASHHEFASERAKRRAACTVNFEEAEIIGQRQPFALYFGFAENLDLKGQRCRR